MAEVVLNGVSRRYGATAAVDGLDLTIGDGELVVLLGPTGAGKTTTLRLVAGLERPDAGSVSIGGHPMADVPPAGRDVAFVFQQFSLYPHLTVFDNLAFPLRSPLHRQPEAAIRQRVEEVAALLRIGHKLGNRATRLSGGEMQRVAIGRALVRRPAVYLMDEPLSALDAKLREAMQIELKQLQRRLGVTTIVVTHDQREAMTMADLVVVMSQGRIHQAAPPMEVYRRPADAFVADFVGTMNRLPATVQDGVLTLGRGALPWAGPDGATEVLVRPEDITVTPAGGHLDARVAATIFLGDRTRMVAETADGLSLTIDAAGRTELTRGDAVSLSFDPARLIILPD